MLNIVILITNNLSEKLIKKSAVKLSQVDSEPFFEMVHESFSEHEIREKFSSEIFKIYASTSPNRIGSNNRKIRLS